jgi:hypothetical protein
MYANLLAAAMRKDLAGEIHPAFVQVIQQLSPDEALILSHIAAQPRPLELRESLDSRGRREFGTDYISNQFSQLCTRAGVVRPDFSDAYLDNLLRLKLFDEFHWTLGQLQNANYFDDQKRVEHSTARPVQLSAFGERFFASCVPD